MSTDGTTPPSIPPRRKPAGGPARTTQPSTTTEAVTETATATSTSSLATAKESVTTTVKKVAQQAGAVLMPSTDTATPATEKKAAEPMTSTTTTAPATGTTSKPSGSGSTSTTGAARPASSQPAAAEGAPRRVRLALSRIDPWSVMKLSFLLSVAIGIMIVVAAAVVWFTLDGLAVFATVNNLVTEIVGEESGIDILQYVEFDRMMSAATLVAVVDVFLLTALATIGAFLYNITAALVGGVTVTLTDE